MAATSFRVRSNEAQAQARATELAGGAETGIADSRFSAGEESVSSLASVALQAPEVRRGKVEALREQLSSGGYQVSSHQIAASIMEQLRVSHGSRPLKG